MARGAQRPPHPCTNLQNPPPSLRLGHATSMARVNSRRDVGLGVPLGFVLDGPDGRLAKRPVALRPRGLPCLLAMLLPTPDHVLPSAHVLPPTVAQGTPKVCPSP